MLNKRFFAVSLILLIAIIIDEEDKLVIGEPSVNNPKNITKINEQIKQHFLVDTNFQYFLIAAGKTVSLVGEMMLLANENNFQFHDAIFNETNSQLRYCRLRPSIIQLSGSLWKYLSIVQINIARIIAVIPQIESQAVETLRLLTRASDETIEEIMPIYTQNIKENMKICMNLANDSSNLFLPTMYLLMDLSYAIVATDSFAAIKIEHLGADIYYLKNKALLSPNENATGNVHNSGSPVGNDVPKASIQPLGLGELVNEETDQILYEIRQLKLTRTTIEKLQKLVQEAKINLNILIEFWNKLDTSISIVLYYSVLKFNDYCNTTQQEIRNGRSTSLAIMKHHLLKEMTSISKISKSLMLVAETYVKLSKSIIVCPAYDFQCHQINFSSNEEVIKANEKDSNITKNYIEKIVQEAKAEFQRYILANQTDFEKLFPNQDEQNVENEDINLE